MAEPGVETSTFAGPGGTADLDTLGGSLTDAEALQEDMLRAVTEQEGVLPWAPDKTLDLNDYLEKGMTPADVTALESRIKALFDDEPRYASMDASVSQVQGLLAVTMTGISSTGVVAELQLQQDGTMRMVRVN